MSFIDKKIIDDDKVFRRLQKNRFSIPKYDPKTYTEDITKNDYFNAIITLRHSLRLAADYHLSFKENSKNIDLFMLTPSISSPSGHGSDSTPIPIKFGQLNTCLVDSSQFGFEPLLLFDFLNKVHCYLPSMRGENPDQRHLNQFFHLEMEMIGTLDNLMPIIEKLVKELARTLLLMQNIIDQISSNPAKTKSALRQIILMDKFPVIEFDQAVDILIKNKKKDLIHFAKKGRDISAQGEIELMKILKTKTPIWVKNYDRDRVPFYQKPDPQNPDKTINADLLFPPIIPGAFGGEIIGCGQRQDNVREMHDSLKRQDVSLEPYKWYVELRKNKKYRITSGFGLGVERFIAWALAKDNIRDVILYPRLKNIKTYP